MKKWSGLFEIQLGKAGWMEQQPRVNFSKKWNIIFCFKNIRAAGEKKKDGHIFGPHIGGQQGSLCLGIIHQFWNHLERFPSTGVQADDNVTDVKEVQMLTCEASTFLGPSDYWSSDPAWSCPWRGTQIFSQNPCLFWVLLELWLRSQVLNLKEVVGGASSHMWFPPPE